MKILLVGILKIIINFFIMLNIVDVVNMYQGHGDLNISISRPPEKYLIVPIHKDK